MNMGENNARGVIRLVTHNLKYLLLNFEIVQINISHDVIAV